MSAEVSLHLINDGNKKKDLPSDPLIQTYTAIPIPKEYIYMKGTLPSSPTSSPEVIPRSLLQSFLKF
ncbi:hypothetical protein TVAG_309080 [Trichomonas vaginalis G3]|uniref:Uncharacterized protein n=1 Tax=Trichomonas vaginalis (strain ATCC PRA-98 / G3) TaxID=412133 RepID=A2EDQ4_TRIV3|nr:hypothetical protein TVAGG3_0944810 [Trichomonas vaginalis G3]EAY09219.1 hypothetical protein TVAG_309080 [Trichomonas vaginalis G3]KAI5486800.1 hypothetical protein TVAGG3_0944810 [Trichomonas vaginalis G3]|eukprot:XP_001321442.1 hypothetical protein [Trichomonas vaginalis G3]